MKRIIFIIFIGITASLSAMQQDPTAAGQLLHVPYDVKGIIWGKVVAGSIKSFVSLARVNKALHKFSYGTYLNNSAANSNIAIKVITAAAQQVPGADEVDIFKRLQQKKLLTQEWADKVSAWLYHVRVPQLVLEKMLRKELLKKNVFLMNPFFRKLLALGVDINAPDKNGETALFKTCEERTWADGDRAWQFNRLLDLNVDVNKATKEIKRTPLMLAASFGNSERVTKLLNAGADWKACDILGENAFDKVLERWFFRARRGWQPFEIIKIFLSSPKIPCDSKIEMIDRALEKYKNYLPVVNWLQQEKVYLWNEHANQQILLVLSAAK